MIYAILSDIHGNLTALKSVLSHIENNYGNNIPIIILGDYIDYGPRPNETICLLQDINLSYAILGNHEKCYLTNDFSRFSSSRGVESLKYTNSILSANSKTFISDHSNHILNVEICGKKILLVHGDLTDLFWGNMNNLEMCKGIYAPFDYVFSGHTHIPNFSEIFFPSEHLDYRNKKKTCFINPGSVGQPRNHNPNAQYCIVDFALSTVRFEKVSYDIADEVTYFNDNIDSFYRDRIKLGV